MTQAARRAADLHTTIHSWSVTSCEHVLLFTALAAGLCSACLPMSTSLQRALSVWQCAVRSLRHRQTGVMLGQLRLACVPAQIHSNMLLVCCSLACSALCLLASNKARILRRSHMMLVMGTSGSINKAGSHHAISVRLHQCMTASLRGPAQSKPRSGLPLDMPGAVCHRPCTWRVF